jgi:hypothetical protein
MMSGLMRRSVFLDGDCDVLGLMFESFDVLRLSYFKKKKVEIIRTHRRQSIRTILEEANFLLMCG